MFGSWRPEQRKVRVVQPVLAVVVHAGLITLAVGSKPVSMDAVVDPIGVPLPVYRMDPRTGSGSTAGDGGVPTPPVGPPVSLPPGPATLAPLPPGTVTLPGSVDPHSVVTLGTRTDSTPHGSVLWGESQVSDPPQLLKFSEPAYPELLRKAGISGAVTVTYVVDPAGYVEAGSVQIVSSDHPAFSESVRDALGRARFTPGRVHGQAVRVLVEQTFRFATRD